MSPFSEIVPSNYSFLNCARSAGKGDGLACVFKTCFTCRTIQSGTFSSFEVLLFHLKRDKKFAIAIEKNLFKWLQGLHIPSAFPPFSDHNPVMFSCTILDQIFKTRSLLYGHVSLALSLVRIVFPFLMRHVLCAGFFWLSLK